MKKLLIASAAIELGAGLVLFGFPSLMAMLFADVPLEGAAALTIARVGGAGLLALGVACWLARNDAQSPAASAVVAAMLVYNVGASIVIAYAGIGFGLHGVALWPGAILHAAMAVWCVAGLQRGRRVG